MWNKIYFLIILFFLLSICVFGQDCSLKISGYVSDESTEVPISLANIYVEEALQGAVSDSTGFFQIDQLCVGDYHLAFSHIGCESQRIYITLKVDTTINIVLDHHHHHLENIIVTGEIQKPTTQEVQFLHENQIIENASQNLSNMIESIAGVSTLKNGSGIAKPVVHGLYGNRLTILNNGIAQSGQQWGNDHSPEIDPLVANKISVIKGVGALEYQGNSLGSVVLVEPKKITKEPHLHGKGSYFFESNGWGNGLNIQLQKDHDYLAWKLNGTFKKSGDKRTADYYLRNTGSQESNIAFQLEKSFSQKWHNDLYFSSFNTILGILRGSHVGNTTDLEGALLREVPFFTEDKFTYQIDAPKQKVNHQLLKLHSKYFIDDHQWIDLTYAGQLNIRKEFDVRRSGRSDIPALDLRQVSNFLEGKYQKNLANDFNLKMGVQFKVVDNTNNPETGILPLIPDYRSYESGLFVLATKAYDQFFLELGGRYDNILPKVVAISSSLPREIIRYNNTYHNISAAGGISYHPSNTIQIAGNIGYASRNPAINELYSNGLHQGVSGIEEGDPNLKTEQSIKTTFSFAGRIKELLFFESLFYYQNIQDYIYLNPQEEIRLTIRGAFPVFKYEQTNAQIYGFDLATTYNILENLRAILKYSYLKGSDLGNDLPLINMPSNNLLATLNYQISNISSFENIELELTNKYVFEQGNLLAGQDFVLPPSAYHLFGLKVSAQKQLKKSRLNIYVKADNLLNISYRDYLNRQRYFADDLGRNVLFGLSLDF